MAKLAITIGDAAGIGPEIILRAMQDSLGVEFVVFGAREIFERDIQKMDLPAPGSHVEFVEVLPEVEFEGLGYGEMDERAARLQLASLEAAMASAAVAEVDGIVTAPWTKALFETIGRPPVGHTEVLVEHFDVSEHVMMLAGDKLRVALVTTHLPLNRVSESLSARLIVEKAKVTIRELRARFGVGKPKLAVAALNPHAGERGAMGSEEIEVIAPALQTLRDDFGDEAEVSGPHPSDTLFAKFKDGAAPYDAVLCMYHDQGLIPLKLLHFGRSANITLGLPVVRTSPDHGSAYDIAGKGVARADSMRYAIDLARDLVKSA